MASIFNAIIVFLGMFTGWKTVLTLLVTSVIGVVFYNLAVEVIDEFLSWILVTLGNVAGNINAGDGHANVTGFAGWMLATLKVPDCLAVVLTCVGIKWMCRKIPFIKW